MSLDRGERLVNRVEAGDARKLAEMRQLIERHGIHLIAGIAALLERSIDVLLNFIRDALQVFLTKLAILFAGFKEIEDRSEQTVLAMWRVHRYMIELGGNIVYLLTFNSFNEFYRKLSLYSRTNTAAPATSLLIAASCSVSQN